MKRLLALVLTLVIALSCASFTAFAETDIRIVIDGQYQNYDVMPVIENSRTLVPMRGIFETLGAVVNWDGDTRTVMAAKDDTVVMLQIDNKTAWINGEGKELDTPAKIMNDRTMVPVRFIAEALGCRVEWDEAQRRVFVYSKNEHQEGFEALNGKKVIVIGNSHTYYGRTVISVNNKYPELEKRVNNKGGLYQLCKANGIDVEVVNMTFGAHTLGEILSDACPRTDDACCGKNHMENLTDKNFDYVVFSPASGDKQEAAFAEDSEKLMSIFREANPDVQIIVLAPTMIYGINDTGVVRQGTIDSLKTMEEKYNVKVCDWGRIVYDILEGNVKVPNTTQEWVKNTFVIKDKKHVNLLGGYMTSLMAYCVATGEKAEGQNYDFFKDASLAPIIDVPGYVDYYYVNGDADSNFPEILASQTEMRGIQQLIDKYIAEKPYLK